MTFFDPCDPYVTFGPMLVTWHVAVKVYVIVTKYGQNPSRHAGVISQKLWLKKERKKELESASASRHWYTGAANIDICFLMTSENVL